MDPSNVAPGLYRVWWREGGGSSLAAVGIDREGKRWIAPTNWISLGHDSVWSGVERVEPLIERFDETAAAIGRIRAAVWSVAREVDDVFAAAVRAHCDRQAAVADATAQVAEAEERVAAGEERVLELAQQQQAVATALGAPAAVDDQVAERAVRLVALGKRLASLDEFHLRRHDDENCEKCLALRDAKAAGWIK